MTWSAPFIISLIIYDPAASFFQLGNKAIIEFVQNEKKYMYCTDLSMCKKEGGKMGLDWNATSLELYKYSS